MNWREALAAADKNGASLLLIVPHGWQITWGLNSRDFMRAEGEFPMDLFAVTMLFPKVAYADFRRFGDGARQAAVQMKAAALLHEAATRIKEKVGLITPQEAARAFVKAQLESYYEAGAGIGCKGVEYIKERGDDMGWIGVL